MMGGMMGGGTFVGGGWPNMMGFGFGGIIMILFWGLIIWAVITVVRSTGRGADRGIAGKSALDILKERYARGEIDKKEFEEKKRDLTG